MQREHKCILTMSDGSTKRCDGNCEKRKLESLARARTFGTIDMFEDGLYIQTGKVKDVSKQIHNNPNIEICAFKDGDWIRLSCMATEDDRVEVRKHMLDAYPMLRNMYDENDGNTEVFRLSECKAIITSFTKEPRAFEF